MPVTIPERPAAPAARPSLWRRTGWFAALYLLGLGTVGAVAFVLRLWIKP